tara:strand:- start:48 stop:236 length:189 start_codon:yes stop_codon:yes gene_type:complete
MAILCGCQREVYICHKIEITEQERNKGNADDIKMLGEVLTWTKEGWQCQAAKEAEAEFIINQ